MARLDYDAVAASYARGRPLALDAILPWRDAVAPYVQRDRRRPILDVGAGTGWFSAAFATWFDAEVVAVEPSAGMRRQAEAACADGRVRFVGGAAERLPLRDGSVSAAWLSTVIHHIGDLGAAAHDLARVLAPDAPVLIRSAFPDRLDAISLFRFFPAARRTAATFPTVEATAAAFAGAGFVVDRRVAVPQVSAPSLAEAAARVRTMRHADSTLRPLTDTEFAAGLAALEAAAAASPPAPVVDEIDLLVLRRP
jgi:SAM-dependent methyltransferase